MDEYEPGMTKIKEGRCPIGATNPMACWFCSYGHATECHHPMTCEEAACSHAAQAESEGAP